MNIYPRKDGKYVIATYFTGKGRFRTEHTVDGIPCEARSVDDMSSAITYSHKRSAKRALKRKSNVVG